MLTMLFCWIGFAVAVILVILIIYLNAKFDRHPKPKSVVKPKKAPVVKPKKAPVEVNRKRRVKSGKSRSNKSRSDKSRSKRVWPNGKNSDVIQIPADKSPKKLGDCEDDYWKSELVVNNMDKITDEIFLGNWASSTRIDKLLDNNIYTIICINDNKKTKYILDQYDENSIDYHHFTLPDLPSADIKSILEPCMKIITESKSPTLVHCTAGQSRSATVVIYYLMKSRNISYSDSLDLVKKYRPIAEPNYGFADILVNLI
jgi:protein-tyrosine phosphatase